METVAEAIRKRPGMYIGDVHDGSGLVHMVWELVSNSLDQHLAGRCSRIDVSLEEDGSVVVDDDGPGMPLIELNGRPFAEVAMTELHMTPTFDGHAPHEHVGSGLHGLGLCPLNALSSRVVLDVFRDGGHYTQRFGKGYVVTRMEKVGVSARTGTRVSLLPDSTIFSDPWFNANTIATRLRELSCLLPGLTLSFQDRRKQVFREPRGLLALLASARRGVEPMGGTLSVDERVGAIRVEVAAEWLPFRSGVVESYANVERTTGGGKHVEGLLDGLDSVMVTQVPDWKKHPKRRRLERVRQGLHAIVCVRLLDPSYGAPTKDRLDTPEAKTAVAAAVRAPFLGFLQSNPELLAHLTSATSGVR